MGGRARRALRDVRDLRATLVRDLRATLREQRASMVALQGHTREQLGALDSELDGLSARLDALESRQLDVGAIEAKLSELLAVLTAPELAPDVEPELVEGDAPSVRLCPIGPWEEPCPVCGHHQGDHDGRGECIVCRDHGPVFRPQPIPPIDPSHWLQPSPWPPPYVVRSPLVL